MRIAADNPVVLLEDQRRHDHDVAAANCVKGGIDPHWHASRTDLRIEFAEVEEALGFTAPTDRPEPTEVVLAALTGCLNAAVSASALKRGLDLNQIEVRASIPWDPFVFLHLTDPETDGQIHDQFGELKVELHVEGNDITDDDIAYLQESMKRSAVYNIFRLPHSCEPSVSLSRD